MVPGWRTYADEKNLWARSSPRCAALRLSCRWLPFKTLPQPDNIGSSSALPPDVAPGSNALNSVSKRPSGFDRNPTAPSSTCDGRHSGSVTVFFFGEGGGATKKSSASTVVRNIREEWKSDTHGWCDIRAAGASCIDAHPGISWKCRWGPGERDSRMRGCSGRVQT